MTATSTRETHFKNFMMGFGPLCGHTAEAEVLTPIPDEVTCPRCLAMMGRVSTPRDDRNSSRTSEKTPAFSAEPSPTERTEHR